MNERSFELPDQLSLQTIMFLLCSCAGHYYYLDLREFCLCCHSWLFAWGQDWISSRFLGLSSRFVKVLRFLALHLLSALLSAAGVMFWARSSWFVLSMVYHILFGEYEAAAIQREKKSEMWSHLEVSN